MINDKRLPDDWESRSPEEKSLWFEQERTYKQAQRQWNARHRTSTYFRGASTFRIDGPLR